MTRRHFLALAEAIRFAHLDPETRAVVAEAIADACSRFNGRFDRGRFIRAAIEPLKTSRRESA